jgi:hypothetical protein
VVSRSLRVLLSKRLRFSMVVSLLTIAYGSASAAPAGTMATTVCLLVFTFSSACGADAAKQAAPAIAAPPRRSTKLRAQSECRRECRELCAVGEVRPEMFHAISPVERRAPAKRPLLQESHPAGSTAESVVLRGRRRRANTVVGVC